MNVLVLGAGVIGVTTAHYLAEAGHHVTVVDRQPGPALETSRGNAGNVCPSYASPWAAPGMRAKAIKWLLQSDAPLRVNWRLDAELLAWMRAWWGECAAERFQRNKPRMQRISRYSLGALRELRQATGIRYDETTEGILQILRTPTEVDAIGNHTRILAAAGIPHRLVDAKGCIEIDPALAHAAVSFAGGLHLPDDETGDCFKFTGALADQLRARGVEFRFDTRIDAIEAAGGKVTGVATSAGRIGADAYVLALGCESVRLARPLGIRLPIQPVKGYSVTLPVIAPDRAPRASLMDEHNKVAITRMGDRLRAAGTAELGATTTDAPPARCATLLRSLRELYPDAADFERPTYWAGLRPMTPDGPPLLGATPLPNLFLNVGQGSQGWSMACGSGQVVARIVSGHDPGIDLEGLTLARYG